MCSLNQKGKAMLKKVLLPISWVICLCTCSVPWSSASGVTCDEITNKCKSEIQSWSEMPEGGPGGGRWGGCGITGKHDSFPAAMGTVGGQDVQEAFIEAYKKNCDIMFKTADDAINAFCTPTVEDLKKKTKCT